MRYSLNRDLSRRKHYLPFEQLRNGHIMHEISFTDSKASRNLYNKNSWTVRRNPHLEIFPHAVYDGKYDKKNITDKEE